MTSLRARLFVILVATTGAIWLGAIAWTYLGTQRELERVLDTRLQEAARMLSSLVRGDEDTARAAIGAAIPNSAPGETVYERQLTCQIWSMEGRLVATSAAAPAERMTESRSGFSDNVIDGEVWRVYAIEDAQKGVRVLVGDRLSLRNRLVQDLVLGLVMPTMLALPLFAVLIWLSVGRGVAPLMQIASDLKGRAGDDLRPVEAKTVDEIRPVMEALNGLFGKLEAARRHERDITAFAAHELRTPLAGIRTQAQVALGTDEAGVRRSALDKIIIGVDRTARLVSQLLALARLDSGLPEREPEPVNVGQLLREIDRERTRADLRVEIDPAMDRLVLLCDPDSLRLALRNLHENACGHSPGGGLVSWLRNGDDVIAVQDEGPGIPEDEIPLVMQRFYRGRGSLVPGSGLGLSIVELALRRLGGDIGLGRAANGSGLRATIRLS